jgi:C1A family cysteine protease
VDHKLGLYKSPYDENDFLIESFLSYITPEEEFDNSENMTPVRSQGQEGSCVGFAMATGVLEYLNNVLDYPEYKELINLSPRYIYENAKKISGHKEGTTLKAAVKTAQKDGVCLEKFWPYQVPQTTPKDYVADRNAWQFKIKAYARVTSLYDLKLALMQFGVVLGGIKVFKSIKDTKSDGIVPTPNRLYPSNWKPRGGHAICFCGYSDERKLVKFKNSWGEDWGDGGYGYLTYEYVKQHMLDAFSVVDVDDPLPYIERTGNLSKARRRELWL